MVFFLYGLDTFLLQRKLKEIIGKYRSKHQSGFNFLKIEATEEGFQKMKDTVETISMFKEKKLIIVHNLLSTSKLIQSTFEDYFKKNLFVNEGVSLIIAQEGEPDKRTKLYKLLFKKAFKKQEFPGLTNENLHAFIKKEVGQLDAEINSEAIDELMLFFGNDLWQIENEIQKLVSFRPNKTISKDDVQKICTANINSNIFETIEAISKKDKKTALRLASKYFEGGDNELQLLSMINYQFRNLIKIKSLLNESKPFYTLQKMTKLHPFVIKKTLPIAQKFSMEQLKEIYKKLLETDFQIKTGKIDPKLGIEMFIMQV
jgi:DNA polymerase-3 subunit delta